MIFSRSLQSVLLLGLLVASAFSGVSGGSGKGSRSGKGGGRRSYARGREELTTSWNTDPDEDNVFSPPVSPPILPAITAEPTSVPTGKPSQPPTVPPSISPSCPHTEAPSDSPSVAPTPPLPTSTPTVSKSPTISPTSSPTKTASPTQTSAPTITAAPSQSYAPTVSTSPSVSPAPTVTAAPSDSSSPTLSFAPTVALCETNADGFFGTTTVQDLGVTFGYELEYEAGYNETTVISDLETSFNNFLLPFLFSSGCPSPNRRILASVRRLKTVGVSKRPDDAPLTDVECAEKSNEANECIVVSGELTVYTDDGNPTTSEESIRSELESGMKNGDFVESPIVRVSYVELEPKPDGSEGGADGTLGTGNGRGNGLVYGVVAAVASLLIIALAVVWRRKKKQQEEESALSSSLENDPTVVDSVGDGV